MISIEILINRQITSFPWEEKNNTFIKGYGVDKLKAIIQDNCTFDLLYNELKATTGHFAFIYNSVDYVYFGTDCIRSFPLFYCIKDNTLMISDDTNKLVEKIGIAFDDYRVEEFAFTGFTTGRSTLHASIEQVKAGEVIAVHKTSGQINPMAYYQFQPSNNSLEISEASLFQGLSYTYDKIFKRLVKSISGRKAIVPLSGGYDSRLIAYQLKKNGHENVLCFTYGHKSNPEVAISQNIAKQLGFDWVFVPYSQQAWKKIEKEYKLYEIFSGNWSSLPHVQDWLAVKILKEQYSIPSDCIFIPGHANDFIAGSHILPEFESDKKMPVHQVKSQILSKHYELILLSKSTLSKKFSLSFPEYSAHKNLLLDNSQAISEMEKWNWQERQAKFIINSMRVYEFFGYEWRIPYWDLDLVKFWENVPLQLRVNRSLFKKYANTEILIGNNVYVTPPEKSDSFFSPSSLLAASRKYTLLDYIFNISKAYLRYKASHTVLFGVVNQNEYRLGSFKGKRNVNSFLAQKYIQSLKSKL